MLDISYLILLIGVSGKLLRELRKYHEKKTKK